MSGNSRAETECRHALKEAMDKVADCDVRWRDACQHGEFSPETMKELFAQLEDAWREWVSAYQEWVKAHANARISEAKQWFLRVNKE